MKTTEKPHSPVFPSLPLPSPRVPVFLGMLLATASLARAADCTTFAAGSPLGSVEITPLKEASGLAASALNPGVVWTHNDGSGKKVYALNLNAEYLARYDIGVEIDDIEDMAVSTGPVAGANYIYLSDGGGAKETTGVRAAIGIVRFPEPAVSSAAPASPPNINAAGVQTFTLTYPDGSYDSEALLVDPVNSDIYVLTKQSPASRLYRANLNALPSGSTAALTFVSTVAFPDPSGATVSADGSQILVRNEQLIRLYNRAPGETIAAALARTPVIVPVIGTPDEPNGEAVSFLRDGSGYLTISEGVSPLLYFFAAQCPRAPSLVAPLVDRTFTPGSTVTLSAQISGEPAPTFSWKFNGQPIAGATSSALTLENFQVANAGVYELTAVNNLGTVTTSATLTLRTTLDLRVTEVSAQPTGSGAGFADWWELTSFEAEPVSLAGWRFNDSAGGLGTAFVYPAGLTIQPGESIIFVEDLTPAQFRAWWGSSLSPTVQIVTHSGNGLAFGASGDGVRLWNSTATTDAETAASVDFGPATAGVTFNYDPATGQFGGLSQLGVNGVFTAATAADIGSPGLIRIAAVAPADLTVSKTPTGLRIDFPATAGATYLLEESDTLLPDDWSETGDTHTAPAGGTASFEVTTGAARKFYRIKAQ